jgi:predicted nucleic acid-binding Zn ribbon protein
LLGVRRLFAACCSPCPVVGNGAETVKEDPLAQSERTQELAREEAQRRLAGWSPWALTMALVVAAIWLWLGNHSLGGGYFASQVFLVPAS